MLLSVFLALFLPCTAMSAVFVVYLCLLCSSWDSDRHLPVKASPETGLSSSQLENLPKITGKDLVMGSECAVCLDDIEPEQPARVVPGCNHGFHLQCADTWLSKNNLCPLCRTKLESLGTYPPDDSPC